MPELDWGLGVPAMTKGPVNHKFPAPAVLTMLQVVEEAVTVPVLGARVMPLFTVKAPVKEKWAVG